MTQSTEVKDKQKDNGNSQLLERKMATEDFYETARLIDLEETEVNNAPNRGLAVLAKIIARNVRQQQEKNTTEVDEAADGETHLLKASGE